MLRDHAFDRNDGGDRQNNAETKAKPKPNADEEVDGAEYEHDRLGVPQISAPLPAIAPRTRALAWLAWGIRADLS
jgi:hypothetical protein